MFLGARREDGRAREQRRADGARAISEGVRQEIDGIRTTIISPGAVQSELPLAISDPDTAAGIKQFYRRMAIPADAVARAIAFAIEQPADVDINEILLRPTAQEL